jgi:dTMP kinase
LRLKRTLVDALAAALVGPVVRLAFPRYGEDVRADLTRDGLLGNLGPFGDEVYGMAMLYALDRHSALPQLRTSLASAEYVILDRYIASNAAFGAARLRQDARGEFVHWVRDIEVGRVRLPVPHIHLLLRVSPRVAAERSQRRGETDAARGQDKWETDDGLQSRAAAVYDQLADAAWLAPWHVVDGHARPDIDSLVKLLTVDPVMS